MDQAITILLLRLVGYLHSQRYETRMWNNEIDPELQEILEELEKLMEIK
jgi:hypothetical protein